MTELEKQIVEHLKAIRDILKENGGIQYLSMCIHADGGILANNLYWKLPKSKGIRIAVWDKDPAEENDDD